MNSCQTKWQAHVWFRSEDLRLFLELAKKALHVRLSFTGDTIGLVAPFVYTYKRSFRRRSLVLTRRGRGIRFRVCKYTVKEDCTYSVNEHSIPCSTLFTGALPEPVFLRADWALDFFKYEKAEFCCLYIPNESGKAVQFSPAKAPYPQIRIQ